MARSISSMAMGEQRRQATRRTTRDARPDPTQKLTRRGSLRLRCARPARRPRVGETHGTTRRRRACATRGARHVLRPLRYRRSRDLQKTSYVLSSQTLHIVAHAPRPRASPGRAGRAAGSRSGDIHYTGQGGPGLLSREAPRGLKSPRLLRRPRRPLHPSAAGAETWARLAHPQWRAAPPAALTSPSARR